MKGRVEFNVDRCKGCGLCVQVCPVKILELDTSQINAIGYNPAYCIDQDKCIACTNCAVMCPDVVITVMRLEASV